MALFQHYFNVGPLVDVECWTMNRILRFVLSINEPQSRFSVSEIADLQWCFLNHFNQNNPAIKTAVWSQRRCELNCMQSCNTESCTYFIEAFHHIKNTTFNALHCHFLLSSSHLSASLCWHNFMENVRCQIKMFTLAIEREKEKKREREQVKHQN